MRPPVRRVRLRATLPSVLLPSFFLTALLVAVPGTSVTGVAMPAPTVAAGGATRAGPHLTVETLVSVLLWYAICGLVTAVVLLAVVRRRRRQQRAALRARHVAAVEATKRLLQPELAPPASVSVTGSGS